MKKIFITENQLKSLTKQLAVEQVTNKKQNLIDSPNSDGTINVYDASGNVVKVRLKLFMPSLTTFSDKEENRTLINIKEIKRNDDQSTPLTFITLKNKIIDLKKEFLDKFFSNFINKNVRVTNQPIMEKGPIKVYAYKV
jgi:hypothetical protein